MSKFTKLERQYVKGVVHNLSLQRFTDQEIVDWLHDEKGIDISRVRITLIRNQAEKQAEKWYILLRDSRYKYIAIYKERIDSLFSYQKGLNKIIATTKKDEVKIRAITELHSIEMDIFAIWKQLPNLELRQQVESQPNPIPTSEEIEAYGITAESQPYPDAWTTEECEYVQCANGCNRWVQRRLLQYHRCLSPEQVF